VSTTEGVTVSLAVLAAAGLLPTWSLVGRRWTVVPLSVLAGTVVSAAAATCFLAIGGSLMGWFLGLALLGALVSVLWLVMHSTVPPADRAPVDRSRPPGTARRPGERVFRGTAAAALVATAIWCLRGLVTPMVGLDTRLFWFLRAGWWLWPHGQALANMHNIGADTHAGYPPLISSTVAVGWWVSGTHSDRIGAVLIAIVNVCAAVAAAWALVELGLMVSARIRSGGAGSGTAGRGAEPARADRWPALDQLPRWCGAGTAVLLVFSFFGVTSVFAFNGYADPLWSVAAVGSVAYLLLVPASGAGTGAAVILLAVAGETKVEGTATAIAIIAIVGLRAVLRGRGTAPLRSRVVAPALVVVGAAIALVVWPAVMRLRHVGADLNTSGPRQSPLWQRTQVTYDALAPHLHIVLLALVLSAAAWFMLRGVRSIVATGSDGWAWVTLVVGLVIVAGGYIDGPGSIYFLDLWLQTSAHRVADFPALGAWWIVAATVVTASAAPATLAAGPRSLPDAPSRPVATAGLRSE
jgi:hypothetical protein